MRSYFPYAFIKDITEKTIDAAITTEQVRTKRAPSFGGIVCMLYFIFVQHVDKSTAKNKKKLKIIEKINIIFFNLNLKMKREL